MIKLSTEPLMPITSASPRAAAEVRQRIIRMSFGFLEDVLRGKRHPLTKHELDVSSDVPPDMHIVAIAAPFLSHGLVDVLVESDTFDPVPEQEAIPELRVTFTTRIRKCRDERCFCQAYDG